MQGTHKVEETYFKVGLAVLTLWGALLSWLAKRLVTRIDKVESDMIETERRLLVKLDEHSRETREATRDWRREQRETNTAVFIKLDNIMKHLVDLNINPHGDTR